MRLWYVDAGRNRLSCCDIDRDVLLHQIGKARVLLVGARHLQRANVRRQTPRAPWAMSSPRPDTAWTR